MFIKFKILKFVCVVGGNISALFMMPALFYSALKSLKNNFVNFGFSNIKVVLYAKYNNNNKSLVLK